MHFKFGFGFFWTFCMSGFFCYFLLFFKLNSGVLVHNRKATLVRIRSSSEKSTHVGETKRAQSSRFHTLMPVFISNTVGCLRSGIISHVIADTTKVTWINNKRLHKQLNDLHFLVNQSCQRFRHMWLQDSELTAKAGSMPAAYPADSTKGFCEVCNNAIIVKYCELKRHNW